MNVTHLDVDGAPSQDLAVDDPLGALQVACASRLDGGHKVELREGDPCEMEGLVYLLLQLVVQIAPTNLVPPRVLLPLLSLFEKHKTQKPLCSCLLSLLIILGDE